MRITSTTLIWIAIILNSIIVYVQTSNTRKLIEDNFTLTKGNMELIKSVNRNLNSAFIIDSILINKVKRLENQQNNK